MGILVQDIADRATDLLLDKERSDEDARWTDAELVRWINDFRIAAITRLPSAFAITAVRTLAQGTKQAIPDDGTMLFDVVRNLANDGVTPGRAIRRTDRQAIDDYDPDWHSATPASTISQFTYDDRAPNVFFVNPPAVAGTKVEILSPAIPAAGSAMKDTIDIGLQYMEAIVNYVAYRAKSKDSEYANAAEAAAYYGAFTEALGVKAQSSNVSSPNQPGNSV